MGRCGLPCASSWRWYASRQLPPLRTRSWRRFRLIRWALLRPTQPSFLRKSPTKPWLVHQLSLRYESDRAQANFLGSEVASSQATVQSLQARSRRTESLLRQEALFSYTDEVPAASSVAQFGGNLVELAAQRAYLSLTLGDVSATVVQLQSEQFQLGRALTTLRGQYHSELETGTVAANQRDQAIGEAAALQGMLAQAQSQVALLTSEQHAQAGLPVGNGIVNAVNQQLGTTSSGTRTMAANEQAGTTGPTTTASSTPATTAPAQRHRRRPPHLLPLSRPRRRLQRQSHRQRRRRPVPPT